MKRLMTASSAVALALLAGCTGSTEDGGATAPTTVTAPATPPPSTASSPTSGATAAPTDQAGPFAAPDQVVTSPGFPSSGGDLLLTGLSGAESHDVHSAVVEFAGSGPVEYQAKYVDEAVAQGSGQRITVPGGAILELSLTGMRYPEPGEDVIKGAELEGDLHVVVDPPFEGHTVVFIGTEHRFPFRVSVLADPVRVVVDLQQ